MSEIKPCPFCGGEADLLDYGLTGARKVVQCSDCGARTRAFDPKIKRGENAIDAWNSRVSAMANIAIPIQVNLPEDWIEQIIERLRNDPEAEWAAIIRCKDCKYSIDFYDDGECYCRRPNMELDWTGDWNFYCGAAERRTDES